MSVPDKAKIIEPTDLIVRVGEDGVWLGFFARDGQSAVVNLDKISDSLPLGSISRTALKAWAADRREQAGAVAG